MVDDQLCNFHAGQVPSGSNETITCTKPLAGRTVKIQKLPLTANEASGMRDPKILCLCQVLVGGYLSTGKHIWTSQLTFSWCCDEIYLEYGISIRMRHSYGNL